MLGRAARLVLFGVMAAWLAAAAITRQLGMYALWPEGWDWFLILLAALFVASFALIFPLRMVLTIATVTALVLFAWPTPYAGGRRGESRIERVTGIDLVRSAEAAVWTFIGSAAGVSIALWLERRQKGN
jgi:hypothetical protein